MIKQLGSPETYIESFIEEIPGEIVRFVARVRVREPSGKASIHLDIDGLEAHINECIKAAAELRTAQRAQLECALRAAYRDPMCVSGHVPDCDCGSPPLLRKR